MKTTSLLTFAISLTLATVCAIAADPQSPKSKAATIILPKITLNNAPIQIAVRFLTVKSRELDPDKTGVTILLTGPEDKQTRVNLDMANISVADAAKKLAEAANLEMRMDGESIVLKSKLPASASPAPATNKPAQQIPGLDPVSK